jgi:hypothetical protein
MHISDCELPTMRHLLVVVTATVLWVLQLSAHAATLLPSQEQQELVTVKTCRDSEVLSTLQAAIDYSLQTRAVLAKGMRAEDINLEAIWIDPPAAICSISVAAKGVRERIIYTIAREGASFVILFPDRLEVRPVPEEPDCTGPIATRPQHCFDTGHQVEGRPQQ